MNLQPAALTALQAVLLAIMVFGLLSLLVPVLPGLVIIWVPILVYAVLTGFTGPRIVLFVIITALMLFGNVVDNLIMGSRAHQRGASWWSVAVALVAGVAGSMAFPPFGGLIAALLALFAVEFFRQRDWRKAFRSTQSMAIGCGWAAFVRFLIGLAMIGLWVVWIKFTA